MALIECYECEKEISDKAPACPHCGAPKEEQPPEIEEAEILESVAVVDEPEPITQETISAPSTDPEPVVTKDKRFNKVVAIPGAPMINKLAEALTTMGFSLKGAVKLTLVVVFGIAVVAGLGEVFSGLFEDDGESPASSEASRPTPEYMLAVIDARRDPPPGANVTAIGRHLDYIAPRCSGEQGRGHISDMAVAVVRLLKDNDGKTRTGQFVLDWTHKMLREPMMQNYRGTCAQLFTISYSGIKAIGD